MNENLWIIVHQPTKVIVSPTDGFPDAREANVWLQRMIAIGQFKLPFLEYRAMTQEAWEKVRQAEVETTKGSGT